MPAHRTQIKTPRFHDAQRGSKHTDTRCKNVRGVTAGVRRKRGRSEEEGARRRRIYGKCGTWVGAFVMAFSSSASLSVFLSFTVLFCALPVVRAFRSRVLAFSGTASSISVPSGSAPSTVLQLHLLPPCLPSLSLLSLPSPFSLSPLACSAFPCSPPFLSLAPIPSPMRRRFHRSTSSSSSSTLFYAEARAVLSLTRRLAVRAHAVSRHREQLPQAKPLRHRSGHVW